MYSMLPQVKPGHRARERIAACLLHGQSQCCLDRYVWKRARIYILEPDQNVKEEFNIIQLARYKQTFDSLALRQPGLCMSNCIDISSTGSGDQV